MSKEVVDCIKRHWFEPASMLVSIFLLIGSFFVPPMAIIDSSILAGVGELLGGAAVLSFLSNLPEYIRAGASSKIQKGDLSIELNAGKEDGDDRVL